MSSRKREETSLKSWVRSCVGAKNTYRAHELSAIQHRGPHESVDLLRRQIENHSAIAEANWEEISQIDDPRRHLSPLALTRSTCLVIPRLPE